MYLVVDTTSRNVLGECANLQEAKALFLELVASHPSAYREITILSESGRIETVPHDEVVAALEAAVTG